MPFTEYFYPLDLSGTSPTNRVAAERHTIAPGSGNLIVLDHGVFFSDSIVVRNADTGVPLINGTDYTTVVRATDAQREVGQYDVHSALLFTSELTFDVLVTAQYLGGKYCRLDNQILQAIREASDTGQPISFSSLLNVPELWRGFSHMTHFGDLTGYGTMVALLAEAVDLLTFSNRGELESMIRAEVANHIDSERQLLVNRIAVLEVEVERLKGN